MAVVSISMGKLIVGVIIVILASAAISAGVSTMLMGGQQGPEGPQGPQGETGATGKPQRNTTKPKTAYTLCNCSVTEAYKTL